MTADRVYRFGPLAVIDLEDDVPRPVPDAGEVLVRVNAVGVGP
jgi:NADPH:quinone reductase-like Zn-dependent oxidoreductase